MTCPDYLLANAQRGDSAGIYAAEGTAFHRVMEAWVDNGMCCHEAGTVETVVAGGTTYEIEVTEEMLAHGNECARHVFELAHEAIRRNGKVFAEQRLDFSDLMPIPNQAGTCDFAAMWTGYLVIRDYKYGEGIRVDALDNSQLYLYAYAAFREWDWVYGFDHISIGVLQPRLEHFDVVEITRADLLAFAERVRETARIAWEAMQQGGRRRVPSPKACQWCDAKARCPARACMLEQLADDSFEDVEEAGSDAGQMLATTQRIDSGEFEPRLVPAAELTTAQLGKLLTYRKDVESWFKAISEELLSRALDGDEVPGWKIAESRTHRKWTDEQAAGRLVERAGVKWQKFWIMEAISPAAAIKLLKTVGLNKTKAEALLDHVMVKPPGNRTLVRASDSRPGIESAAEDFEDVSDDL